MIPFVFVFLFLGAFGYDRDYCEFGTNDYTLEWAFEPSSQNVVFVLKQNSTKPAFWTGVGFSASEKTVDFVGVLIRNGQVAIADAYLNGSGVLYTDAVGNLQIIGHEYNGKSLVAKFARPIESTDQAEDVNLSGCLTFLLPKEDGDIDIHGIRPNLSEFHRFKVCDIKTHCSIDMRKNDDRSKSKTEKVKFAKSVDYSGSGDPCSFAGEDYVVNWTYVKKTDSVEFSMKMPQKSSKWWSAVGIGDTMADMDIGVIFVENGKAKKIGDYISNSYGVPDEDSQQDWKLEGSTAKDDRVELRFSRAVKTSDSDQDRSMEDCVLFQFAANAGRYGNGFQLRKHENWPDLYKACDLREHCEEKSFEKRARNRKNKNKNPTTTPATEENNDQTTTEIAEEGSGEEPNQNLQTTEIPQNPTEAQNPPPQQLNAENPIEEPKTTTNSPTENPIVQNPETTPIVPSIPSEPQIPSEAQNPQIPSEVQNSPEPQNPSEPQNPTETTNPPEQPNPLEEKQHNSTPNQPTEQPKPTAEENAVFEENPKNPEDPKPEIPTAENSQLSTVSPSLPDSQSPSDKCDPTKEDLSVCRQYMDNYLGAVAEWAQNHGEQMNAQYGKACALLGAVPHVPTLCCHIYQKICDSRGTI